MGRQDFETETLLAVGGFPDSFEGHFDRESYEESGRLVPLAFRAAGQDGFTPSEISPPISSTDGGGAGVPTIAFFCKDHGADVGDIAPTLRSMGHTGSHPNAGGQIAVAIGLSREMNASVECIGALDAGSRTGGGQPSMVATSIAVRRLTPRECERLQDFPDDYTKISDTTADGPRYKALGNSWAVCCARWIVRRMKTVDGIREAEQVGQR